MSKGSDFNFSVSTLLGARQWVLKKLATKYLVEPEYKVKWKKSAGISKLIALLAKVDAYRWKRLAEKKVFEQPPVFILGHWRSGTTYLHNLICSDPRAGYPTTYQTIFPNNLFAFQGVLKFFLKLFLPVERPGDGLPLLVDQPQEEEFALGNEIDYCFYYWMYFPKDAVFFRDAHFSVDKISNERALQWKENYQRFVKRSLVNTGGEVFVSKNPPNTARIKWILELFPEAKFIFIYRNPYEVYRSTKKFFNDVIPPLQFQDIDNNLFEEHILASYTALHTAYFEQRNLIPQENLVEVAYEDLITNPYRVVEQLANTLKFPSMDKIDSGLKVKIEKSKTHQIDDYVLDAPTIEKINARWGSIFTQFGYSQKTV